MNIAPEILNYLSERREFAEVILAPKASPVERRGKSVRKIMDVVLSAEDIRDTLVSLRSHTPVSLGPLGREGFFSFGIPDVGRIRVTYLTQRGSYVVSIVKVPYDIPSLKEIVGNYSDVKELFNILNIDNGIVPIIGRSFVTHNLFSYSLLKEICTRESGLIYILERPLTYLIKHDVSIVIQREVGVDVESFEKGIEEALFVHPEIIYISDITTKDGLDALKNLLDIPILTLISVTASNTEALKSSLEALSNGKGKDIVKRINKVVELKLEEEDKIRFSLKDI